MAYEYFISKSIFFFWGGGGGGRGEVYHSCTNFDFDPKLCYLEFEKYLYNFSHFQQKMERNSYKIRMERQFEKHEYPSLSSPHALMEFDIS